MDNQLIYFLKVSIICGILFSTYRFLFHRKSYYCLNRFFILFILFFSLICPVLKFNSQYVNYSLWINSIEEFPVTVMSSDLIRNPGSKFSFTGFIKIVYFLGVGIFLVRFLIQIYRIINLKKTGNHNNYGESVIIYHENNRVSFSFFHWIFLPFNRFNDLQREIIVNHEEVHGRKLHSLDLLIMEIYSIAFWFNPFVFLLKKSLKEVHEFETDEKVIQEKIPMDDYLNLLLITSNVDKYTGILNLFHCVTIKNRIEMIIKNKTSRKGRISYFLLFPILTAIVMGFSSGKGIINVPSIRPVKGEICVPFEFSGINPVTKKHFVHGGIDIKAPLGTKVVATAPGEVIEVTEKKDWGKLVIIRHGEEFETWYAHLESFSVKKGEMVSLGHEIGQVGNTGYSTGPHLHYEVRKNGVRVNPEEYFN